MSHTKIGNASQQHDELNSTESQPNYSTGTQHDNLASAIRELIERLRASNEEAN